MVLGDTRGAGLTAEVFGEIAQGLDSASGATLRFEHHHVVAGFGEMVRRAQAREPRTRTMTFWEGPRRSMVCIPAARKSGSRRVSAAALSALFFRKARRVKITAVLPPT